MGWASDVAAELLRRQGIKYIALNPGASYRGFHDSIVNYLGNQDPQMLLCLHEDHAVSVAHGYAKVTGEPMACVLHSNVGLLHGLMGIFNAWCDRAPMIVMGATGPVDALLRRPWIDWIHTAKDQGALLRNFTKFDDEPRSPGAVVETMLRAVMVARTKPTGPVYVCLDAGLQETELTGPIAIPDLARYAVPAAPEPSNEALEKTAEWLCTAKNPLIMAGRLNLTREDWDRRVKLAELLGAGVMTELKTGSTFPTEHPLQVAPPFGFMSPPAKEAIKAADVILALDWVDLGGSFKQATGNKDRVPAKIVNVSLDSYLHNGWSADHFSLPPADLAVLADPDAFVARLLPVVEDRLKGKSRWDGKSKAAPRPAQPRAARDPNSRIVPRDIGIAIGEARGDRKITITKTALGWAGEAYPFRDPLDCIGSGDGGGLGGGPGMAVGAGLALKGSGRIPLANLGDGDFIQGGTALWTAAHYQIPVLFVISNNQSNFNDEVHQENVAKDRHRPVENNWIGMRIEDPPVDIAAFARSQGVKAPQPIEKLGDLVPAIKAGMDAVASGEPYLIDVRVERGYSAPIVTRAE
jgi:thiamine pyrophosphate-dependent acetolactate synthase large subunit-like protein